MNKYAIVKEDSLNSTRAKLEDQRRELVGKKRELKEELQQITNKISDLEEQLLYLRCCRCPELIAGNCKNVKIVEMDGCVGLHFTDIWQGSCMWRCSCIGGKKNDTTQNDTTQTGKAECDETIRVSIAEYTRPAVFLSRFHRDAF